MESSYYEIALGAVESCKSEIESYLASETWKNRGTNDGITRWTTPTPLGLDMLKAIGGVQADPETILTMIWDHTRRHEWDEMLISSTLLHDFEDEHLQIMHEAFTVPWPASNRDFIFAHKVYREGGRIMIAARSVPVEHAGDRGVVRGSVNSGCIVIEPENEWSRVTYFINIDPRGHIPKWIVNLSVKKQSRNIASIRRAVEQQ